MTVGAIVALAALTIAMTSEAAVGAEITPDLIEQQDAPTADTDSTPIADEPTTENSVTSPSEDLPAGEPSASEPDPVSEISGGDTGSDSTEPAPTDDGRSEPYRAGPVGATGLVGLVVTAPLRLIDAATAGPDGTLVALNDEGTGFTAAGTAHVGGRHVLELAVGNMIENPVFAIIEIQSTDRVRFDVTGSDGAQIAASGPGRWLMRVDGLENDNQPDISVTMRVATNAAPGYYSYNISITPVGS